MLGFQVGTTTLGEPVTFQAESWKILMSLSLAGNFCFSHAFNAPGDTLHLGDWKKTSYLAVKWPVETWLSHDVFFFLHFNPLGNMHLVSGALCWDELRVLMNELRPPPLQFIRVTLFLVWFREKSILISMYAWTWEMFLFLDSFLSI